MRWDTGAALDRVGTCRDRLLKLAFISLLIGPLQDARGAELPYWLQFGKPAQTCSGGEHPFKVQGASWGVLASGIVICRRTTNSYTYTVQFLNFIIDPSDKQSITHDVLNFDWIGMALFKANASGDDIDWLYERQLPIKGALPKNSVGRVVFGAIRFEVPARDADRATNMLFYVTFQGPMVVIVAI